MKHPNREEWIPFICGEASAEARQQLARHLEECPSCAREVSAWRRSLRKLDRWKLPPAPSDALIDFRPALKWALAAVFVVGLGFLGGRLSASRPAVNTAQLRAEIVDSVRTALRQELDQALHQVQEQTATSLAAADARVSRASALDSERLWRAFVEVLQTARTEDRQAVQAALNDLRKRHETEWVALRKDLETLASMTDEEFSQARLKLLELASVRTANN